MRSADSGSFNLDGFLPYHLHTVSQQIIQLTTRRYAQKLGITVAEGRVLTAVHSFGPLSTRNIADRTRMDKAKITRAVKRLVARGLLDRRINPDDNRLIILTLTPDGIALHAAIVPIIRTVEDSMVAAVGEAMRDELMGALRKIEARLDEALKPARTRKPRVTAESTDSAKSD